MPIFPHFVEDAYTSNDKLFFLFLNLDMVERNSAPEDQNLLVSKRDGIMMIKIEKMQSHFSSNVSTAISCPGILNSLIFMKARSIQA